MRSFDSYSQLRECQSQFATAITKLTDAYQKELQDPDGKVSIQRDKNAVQASMMPKNEEKKSLLYVTRWFCLPLGMDPRPKDQSTWILWEHSSGTAKGGYRYSDWSPGGGYLTQFACEREQKSSQQGVAKFRKETEDKGQKVSSLTYYKCLPAGVDPWGKYE